MTTINAAFLDYLLSPLAGLGDVDGNDLENIDGDNQRIVQEVIKNYMKPEFINKPNAYKEKAKMVLSYYLSTDKIDFGRVYDSALMPFAPPERTKDFFIWIWQVYFENEDYLMMHSDGVREIYDLNEPLTLLG